MRIGIDEAGMPVTETDRDYAALSPWRCARAPSPTPWWSGCSNATWWCVHASEAEAVAAIAADVAPDLERPGAVAVTVATNAEAEAVTMAVRELRVAAGTVNDAVVTSGMEGVRIGPGDHIVTRRNDAEPTCRTGRAGWSKRCSPTAQWWPPRAPAGSTWTRPMSARRSSSVTPTTDYGNEGVTTTRSVTSVGSATSAGGLYVGATRGRYDNTLHLVARGPRGRPGPVGGRPRARPGRSGARRGPGPGPGRGRGLRAHRASALEPDPPAALPIDPAQWRTEAELDQRERQIEVRFSLGMSAMHPVAVMDDDERQRANEADQAAAAAARREAAAQRAEADRIAATKDELVARASGGLHGGPRGRPHHRGRPGPLRPQGGPGRRGPGPPGRGGPALVGPPATGLGLERRRRAGPRRRRR